MDHDSSSPPSSTTVGKSNSNIGTSTSVGTNFAPLFGDRLGSSGLTPGVSANAWETPPPSRHPASLADDLAPATSVLTVDDENALDLDIAAVMNSQLGSEGLPPTPEATTGKKTPAAAADDDAAAQEPAAKKPKETRIFLSGGQGGNNYGRSVSSAASSSAAGGGHSSSDRSGKSSSSRSQRRRGSKGRGGGDGARTMAPASTTAGYVTRVFPNKAFCIVNGDIYVGKPVIEASGNDWPPLMGQGVRVSVVPGRRDTRNRWKAVAYAREPALDFQQFPHMGVGAPPPPGVYGPPPPMHMFAGGIPNMSHHQMAMGMGMPPPQMAFPQMPLPQMPLPQMQHAAMVAAPPLSSAAPKADGAEDPPPGEANAPGEAEQQQQQQPQQPPPYNHTQQQPPLSSQSYANLSQQMAAMAMPSASHGPPAMGMYPPPMGMPGGMPPHMAAPYGHTGFHPQSTMFGVVTRIFDAFCIINDDVYASKAVVERAVPWPPVVGSTARLTVVENRKGRNNWKATRYDAMY